MTETAEPADHPTVSNGTLAKICALLIFDCLITAGILHLDDFGLLRSTALGVMLLQPIVLFNLLLLLALRRARAVSSVRWPWIIAVALAAAAFAILWPPAYRLLVYSPGSMGRADWLASPSPLADLQLAATGLFWLYVGVSGPSRPTRS